MIRAGDVAKVLVSFQKFQVSLRAYVIVSEPRAVATGSNHAL
jgi:hypothetical protein